ncbi:MAG: endonuclease III [Chloroflexi bacterium]|nr:endonuclease III [Chloroflexota bacterium]
MEIPEKALEVHRRLLEFYGPVPQFEPEDPLSTLVGTILSQNTNDDLSDRAYSLLRQRFPTWEAVRDAPVEDIAAAIQVSGLSKMKARYIQNALHEITRRRGDLELDFLRELPVDQAKRWLTGLKGIGPKTAAIVLLFSLGMPAFPVDTHVHRVALRLGLLPARTSREQAHALLEQQLTPALFLPFHLNLIRHGRRICAARHPDCLNCPLADICDYFAHALQERGFYLEVPDK